MPELRGTKNLDQLILSLEKSAETTAQSNRGSISPEKTGAQILAQPLAGGILFPSWNDELPQSYGDIWGDLADFPGFPCADLTNIPANDAFGLQNGWNFFYTRRALWYRAIRAMRRDPTINLARILSIAPILSAGWSYEETDDAPEGARDYIEKEIEPFRLDLIQTGMMNCLDFGWQSYEKVLHYSEEDHEIHIKKLKPLLPDLTHIRVDQLTGEFIGLQQFQNFASIERNAIINLDLDQSLLYYIDHEGTNWYGNSVMRIAEMPHRFSSITNRAAMRYDLKIAGSHWVVSYPIGTSPYGPGKIETDNFLIAQDIIRTLEASGAVAIPTMLASYISDLNSVGGEFASEKRDWRVEILSDNSAGSQSFDTRLRYLDSLKFRAFGLPERSGIEGQFGTKAEAGEHIDFALTHILFRGDKFCQLTNIGLVNQLLRYRHGPRAENTVFIKQKPLTDEAKQRLFQLYMKLLELPTAEAQEVSRIDFNELAKKCDIPINQEFEQGNNIGDEEQGPVDESKSLEAIMQSINPTYGETIQGTGNGTGLNREKLFARINGDNIRDYSHLDDTNPN